jgi:hypothetical protein
METLLTADDLASRLQVPVSWVYRHTRELGAIRLGKYVRFDWLTVRARLHHPLGSQPNAPSETRVEGGS